MRTWMMAVVLAACTLGAQAQKNRYYTKYCPDKELVKKANDWMDSGAWRHGFTAASPREVNAVEFYEQYQKNTAQWKALFEWLAKTDLTALAAGRHKIEGSDLVASVEDDTNKPYGKMQSESHFHHIDFQYVVKGVERFGIIDHYTSRANCPYRPDVIHYDYDPEKTKMMDSTPQDFFLFFPGDWHIAKIESPKVTDQHIRVVVVKVDYVK